jgi:hypothetical protein
MAIFATAATLMRLGDWDFLIPDHFGRSPGARAGSVRLRQDVHEAAHLRRIDRVMARPAPSQFRFRALEKLIWSIRWPINGIRAPINVVTAPVPPRGAR